MWLAQDNIEAAQLWAEERGLDVENAEHELGSPACGTTPYYLREIEYISLARLCIAKSRVEDAVIVLKALESATERLGRTGIRIEILVLQAMAFSAMGDQDRAVDALGRAVLLAEPEGYVRMFVDEGAELVPLLRLVAARGTAPLYVGGLLAASDGRAPSDIGKAPASGAAQALVEPISEREMDVLRLLNTHLTSTLMADELFIAVSTVRSHIKSIYGKLDVHSREEAVQCAQELGLL
jgi:LuxR family maltose regulon positive regulatory protein